MLFWPLNRSWAAANGGVTNGGLRGVCPPFLEIGRNRPFSPVFCTFFALFRRLTPAKSRKRRKKAFFLRYLQISLHPHLLNPHLRHSNAASPYLRVRRKSQRLAFPEGPNLEKIQDRPPGLRISSEIENEWHVQARLKISSEPPTKPLFLWGILKVKIEHFKRDWSFQARLKISSENLKFSSAQARLFFFSRFGPSAFGGDSPS